MRLNWNIRDRTVPDVLRWTVLRDIGNSAPAKLTILIPLVGYLIIFNEHVLKYLELSHQLFGNKDSQSTQISPRLFEVDPIRGTTGTDFLIGNATAPSC
jgi:hypothetical protein